MICPHWHDPIRKCSACLCVYMVDGECSVDGVKKELTDDEESDRLTVAINKDSDPLLKAGKSSFRPWDTLPV